ncbi:nascent polypeptide-associated complex subunit alpha, muscle-specific form-like [Homarus americanus]|uniref:nascent polypeptide-associated complex subunit alpha, muscle-specific form-like n=1 Tax=Homarus americanus TaxID=6706 RepID=UPI001C4632BF|nr:nascent polypeptide-associated complex subunit alpha, muscle-specific form-like [Homarus americanus]
MGGGAPRNPFKSSGDLRGGGGTRDFPRDNGAPETLPVIKASQGPFQGPFPVLWGSQRISHRCLQPSDRSRGRDVPRDPPKGGYVPRAIGLSHGGGAPRNPFRSSGDPRDGGATRDFPGITAPPETLPVIKASQGPFQGPFPVLWGSQGISHRCLQPSDRSRGRDVTRDPPKGGYVPRAIGSRHLQGPFQGGGTPSTLPGAPVPQGALSEVGAAPRDSPMGGGAARNPFRSSGAPRGGRAPRDLPRDNGASRTTPSYKSIPRDLSRDSFQCCGAPRGSPIGPCGSRDPSRSRNVPRDPPKGGYVPGALRKNYCTKEPYRSGTLRGPPGGNGANRGQCRGANASLDLLRGRGASRDPSTGGGTPSTFPGMSMHSMTNPWTVGHRGTLTGAAAPPDILRGATTLPGIHPGTAAKHQGAPAPQGALSGSGAALRDSPMSGGAPRNPFRGSGAPRGSKAPRDLHRDNGTPRHSQL